MPARRPARRRLSRPAAWLAHHARALADALGRLRDQWLPTLMTTAVIGIALGLPAVFVVLVDNAEAVAGDWQGRTRISAFLEKGLSEADATEAAATVRQRDDIAGVTYISPEAALAEFRAHSEMDRALELLEDNPLPGVLVIEPTPGLPPPDVEELSAALRGLAPVTEVRLDREWLQRLHAILELARRGAWLIGGLLGMAVLLVVGNTIRLEIENRREEIVITKLLGATDGFVRRPFLYTGLWHGLLGGVFATVLVQASWALLSGPANALARSYASGFRLRGLDGGDALTLVATGVALGLLGSWIAVGRHLGTMEPR
ncbi:permease-like cell division protein FtsX [Arhodomonas sp. SL1]|uniref:permease-like cell division protein FtsX n=1 Tax=Arhodomonas sp. SL1 TaxID=3425691 RepID=UPI003F8856AA